MDKTDLANEVAELFRMNGHAVEVSVKINHREIDVVARELQGIFPKTYLIECADYAQAVGVGKMQDDLNKLAAARRELGESAVLVHVSRNGYTQEAAGLALSEGVSHTSIENIRRNLINFEPYVTYVRKDPLREIILREYQPTAVSQEGGLRSGARKAVDYLEAWRLSSEPHIFILGDYGVGKSWMLRRYLYHLLDSYEKDNLNAPLPFFIPLQQFTKAFDFQNLILKTFHSYGLSGAHFEAFLHLMRVGRVILLLDSFDEMAQHLDRSVVRANLRGIFTAAAGHSRIVVTSRPNYFENRAERILMVDRYRGGSDHQLDVMQIELEENISIDVGHYLERASFARLNDLSETQRRELFKTVLGDNSAALKTLDGLMSRFQSLKHLSQRAVIARLLTTVAETLADSRKIERFDGQPLVPDDLKELSEAKIFEIIVHNLLHRDQGIGSLSAKERLTFLRRLAVYLQGRGRDPFASPDEIREIVRDVFASNLAHTDAPEQQLESFYRTCRRHSGLTTEGQFHDTSGVIDLPVADADMDSRVGFSHNSLREYLVADYMLDAFQRRSERDIYRLFGVSSNDQIIAFAADICQQNPTVMNLVSGTYVETFDSKTCELLFPVLWSLVSRSYLSVSEALGNPPQFKNLDLSLARLDKIDLSKASFEGCLLQDTDFTDTDLGGAVFPHSILDRTRLDGTNLRGAALRESEIASVFVFDSFVTKTSAVLTGTAARQWLFSRGADVDPTGLNPHLGKPWYEAAREVVRTLEKRAFGAHQARSLSKGTDVRERAFAEEFVGYLLKNSMLQDLGKSHDGGRLVKVDPAYLPELTAFAKSGVIGPSLRSFFDRKFG